MDEARRIARIECEAGILTDKEVAAMAGVARATYQVWRKRFGWGRTAREAIPERVKTLADDPRIAKPLPQPVPTAKPEYPSTLMDPENKEIAVEVAARRGRDVMMEHRATLSKAGNVALMLLDQLEEMLATGRVDSVMEIKTRSGTHYRISFLGDRESLSDAYAKIASGLFRVIPLERQAYGIENPQDSKPPVVIQIGSMEVKSTGNGRRAIVSKHRVIDGGQNGPVRILTQE